MRVIHIFTMVLVCVGLLGADLSAQPEQEQPKVDKQEAKIPDGFEVQTLELGGQIFKPVNWKYESREVGKTLSCKMWEPLPDNQAGFETAFMIDIVTNTADVDKSPSEYAAVFLKSLEKKGKVVTLFTPETKKGLVHSGVLLDEMRTVSGAEKEYRIRYLLVADDANELLFAITFGTTVANWKKYEPTFRVMTKRLTLFDLSKETKSK